MPNTSHRSKLVLTLLIDLVIFLTPFIFLLGSFELLLSNGSYVSSLAAGTATLYNAEPKISQQNAAVISAEVAGYVRGGPEITHRSLFHEEEVSHLADVRRAMSGAFLLFKIVVALAAACIFAIFVLARKLAVDWKGMVQKGFLTAGTESTFVSSLAIVAYFSFDTAFTAFHLLLFNGTQWQFPANYLLVNLFSQDFFALFARNLIIMAFIEGALLLAAGFFVKMHNEGKWKRSSIRKR